SCSVPGGVALEIRVAGDEFGFGRLGGGQSEAAGEQAQVRVPHGPELRGPRPGGVDIGERLGEHQQGLLVGVRGTLTCARETLTCAGLAVHEADAQHPEVVEFEQHKVAGLAAEDGSATGSAGSTPRWNGANQATTLALSVSAFHTSSTPSARGISMTRSVPFSQVRRRAEVVLIPPPRPGSRR